MMGQAIGSYVAVLGGFIAQAPDTHVGMAGLLVGLAGLGFQMVRGYLDYRLAMRRLDGFEARAAELERQLKGGTRGTIAEPASEAPHV